MSVLKEWSVYMIETENGALYTGITKDLKRRFDEHSSSDKSAKFFRSSKPKAMVFSNVGFTYSEALKEEARIKRLSKPQKIEFIRLSEENSARKKLPVKKTPAKKLANKKPLTKKLAAKKSSKTKKPIKKEKTK